VKVLLPCLEGSFVLPLPVVAAAHSMEEAEQLCDRLGIFVDGQFQCIGNPKELHGALRGHLRAHTITTPQDQEPA